MRTFWFSAVVLAMLSNARPHSAAEPPIDYVRDIKPILAARCYACHGGLKQKGKLRVDTTALIHKGGSAGPAIVAGKSAASLLLERVTQSGKRRMPPDSEGEALTGREIALLQAWIDQGAVGPADEKPETAPRDHWAFRAPVRPTVPVVKNTSWVRNPIDAFVAAEHERRGLKPQPAADRQLLVRRVHLDLTGLPPTRAELEAARTDMSADWYEKVVERLLASKQYGERWGRHWMDIWRYSDWWGLGPEVRYSQKHMWHWRDWIIESLNADKGYDQMVREMLAADELYPDDLDRLRATGYLVRPYFLFNRTTWLDEVVEHTSKAFLGLTMNCAKCHDHKYDPIAQTDYYRMRAFFEPYQVRTDQLPGEINLDKDGLPRVFDCNLDAPTYRFVRGDDRMPVKDDPLAPGVPALLDLGGLDIQPVQLPPVARFPGLRPFVLEDHLKAVERQIAAARDVREQARKTLARREASQDAGPVDPSALALAAASVVLAEKGVAAAEAEAAALQARAAADRARYQAPPAADSVPLARAAARSEAQLACARWEETLARGELDVLRAEPAKRPDAERKRNAYRDSLARARERLESPGQGYTPLRGSVKSPESNVETDASRAKSYPETSSGRRSALARWLTHDRQPLTARVAVNHMWARHFGQPLVPTVFDFGRKGQAPSHPALLDYLAVELHQNGWSMKYLHRLMVTSSTYRMTSSSAGTAADNWTADAENRFLWRMHPLRMEAQAVRDSLLHLAGELDLTLGGPSIPVQAETSRRRSLYFVHSHNDRNKFLAMFDDASVQECYRRAESIVPQQALALFNSSLSLSAADKIAARLDQELGNAADNAFVRAAFQMVLAYRPSAAEEAACAQALADWGKLNPKRARANLVHALLNHNDFITVR